MITIINIPDGAVGWIVENEKLARVVLGKSKKEVKLKFKTLHIREIDKTNIPGLLEEMERYFLGKPVDFTNIPVDLTGYTKFARKIFRTLRKEVGYGERITYGNLAKLAGLKGKYSRAIGSVLRINKSPIIIPCHRVIKQNGDLGSYNQGDMWKRYLLDLELKGISL